MSLTGIVMSAAYARDTAFPQLERLKADTFDSHPDHPIVLHRKELVARKAPFQALRNPAVEVMFNARLLTLLREFEYRVITVVIDKQEHLARYRAWRYDPYHYCLECLLERYVTWLDRTKAVGDVIAEVRGGKPDRKLENLYRRFYQTGTSFVGAQAMQDHLTSKDLKLRPKSANVTGLQIADLIAHPSALYVRSKRTSSAPPDRFGGQVMEVVRTKYHRGPYGRVEGVGVKWLP